MVQICTYATIWVYMYEISVETVYRGFANRKGHV